MSTDLQLRHELPKLRTSATKTDVSSNRSTVTHVKVKQDGGGAAAGGDDESYRTPTSKESKIPAILKCPPAPRKPKQPISCKRKLMHEYQFLEVQNMEEMEAFFRSTFPKRSCRCT